MVSALDYFLFGGLPYIAMVLFFGVQAYRWATYRFGWTAKSTLLFSKQLLGVVAVPIHYGIIALLIAHVLGVILSLWLGSLVQVFFVVGTLAGATFLYATAVALIRRIAVREVRSISAVEDYALLAFLLALPSIGLYQAHVAGIFGLGPIVSIWIQSIFTGAPEVDAMAALPLLNKVHIILAMLFFTYWPFTKMAGMLSFPITYLYRRYQVMRKHRRVFYRPR